MEFKLRPFALNDVSSLVKYANNRNIAKNVTDKFPFPYLESDAKAFLESAAKSDPGHIFAIDINAEVIGGICVHPLDDIYRKNAELGYWLAEPFWGQGIITNAIKQVVAFTFATYDINRIFARPFAINIGSQKVLKKNNFKLEGQLHKVLFKNGEYLDELTYAIRRENWIK